MNRLKFYTLLMPLAMGMFSLASCSSDDYNNEQETKERCDVTSFDQVNYLQNNIIEIDSLGNVVQRVCGIPESKSDTTVLSIKVADINAAKEMFESWLSPDTKTTLISPSTTDMQADLTDGDGNVKETVYFRAVNSGNEVAEMTFAGSGVFKHFSKVKFVTAWQLPFTEGRSPYAVGDFEQHETYQEGMQNWVCIREAKNGISGMLMYISSKSDNWNQSHMNNFASVSLAKAASEVLRSNNNWDTFVEYFKEAGQDRLNKGDYYWIDEWKFYLFGKGIYAIRLSDGDIDWFEIVWKNPKKHFIQVRTFGLLD